MRLLIVDDSAIVRRAIERFVTDRLVEVRTASNGADALQEFAAFDPDVVTLDITMPILDGLSCVEAMIRDRPDVKILVISALADRLTAVEAVERGAQGYLLKPFDAPALRRELADILEA